MCNRGATEIEGKPLRQRFGLTKSSLDEHIPNFNVPPTGPITGILQTRNDRIGQTFTWGYMPPYAKDHAFIGKWHSNNSRNDNVRTSRMYCEAFRRRRCLIVISGWYEWPRVNGPHQPGIPSYISPTEDNLFICAGIWTPWTDPKTNLAEDTVAMMTVGPNSFMADLPHDRMPALLGPTTWEEWLDPRTSEDRAFDLMQPCPDKLLQVWEVRPIRGNGPELIEPRIRRPKFQVPSLFE